MKNFKLLSAISMIVTICMILYGIFLLYSGNLDGLYYSFLGTLLFFINVDTLRKIKS